MRKLHIIFLVLVTALLSLGQLQRISLGPVTAIYAHDIVIISWILLLISTNAKQVLLLLWQMIKAFFSNWLLVSLALIILVGWTGAIVTDAFQLWVLFYCLRLITYLSLGWLLFNLKPVSTSWLHLSFVSSGLLVTFFGLLQYLLIPDIRSLSIIGWDDHYYRLVSTQFDPNFAGMIISITLFWLWSIPFSFWEWLIHGLKKEQLQKVQKGITFLCSGLLLAAVALTFSRSSLLALIVGLITYGYLFTTKTMQLKETLKKFRLAGLAILTIILTTLIIAPKPSGEGINLLRTTSAYARVSTAAHWLNTLEPYQVIIGRGLFVPPKTELEFQPLVDQDHANLADNLIVLLISSVGLIGTSLFLIIIISFIQSLTLKKAVVALVLSLVTHTMFNNSLLQPFILLFVIAILVENSMSNQLIEKVKKVTEKG